MYSVEQAQLDVDNAILEAGSASGSARIHIDELQLSDVERSLAKLKPKTSASPNEIPAYIFKDCCSVLAEPLLFVYNRCLELGFFPDLYPFLYILFISLWKVTRVVPVPKACSGLSIEDYRPLAVLSTPAKVFEAAIQKNIFNQAKGQLSDAHYDFRPGRSTTSNTLNYMAEITPVIDDSRGQVDVTYFDFRKAFDVVDR